MLSHEKLKYVSRFIVNGWEPINEGDDSEGLHLLINDNFPSKIISSIDELRAFAEYSLNDRFGQFLLVVGKLFEGVGEQALTF